MTDATAQAARTLAVLWSRSATDSTAGAAADTPPARGRRPGLTLDAVVTAATALADTEGLGALTMRAVATALGVVPMTLYTYVPGKRELLAVMLDTAYLAMPRRPYGESPWRERLIAVARDNRALYERHPWAAAASPVRPPLGPGLMAKYEHELAAFDGLGLDDIETDSALTCLLDFVQGSARAAADAHRVQRESTLSDETWWAANEPLLARVFDETVYPRAVRIGAAAGAAHGAAYDPDHAYQFGLARVLDGLGVLIEARDGRAEA